MTGHVSELLKAAASFSVLFRTSDSGKAGFLHFRLGVLSPHNMSSKKAYTLVLDRLIDGPI